MGKKFDASRLIKKMDLEEWVSPYGIVRSYPDGSLEIEKSYDEYGHLLRDIERIKKYLKKENFHKFVERIFLKERDLGITYNEVWDAENNQWSFEKKFIYLDEQEYKLLISFKSK